MKTNENPNPQKTTIRVPLYAIDLGQAVYHGNYFHLFDIGRENFFRHIEFPYKKLMDMEKHLTIVEATCKYKKSLHYDEEIEIHTYISWIKSRSLGMEQKIYKQDKDNNTLLCTALSLIMVCVNFQGKANTIPKELIECIEKYLVMSNE